MLTAVLGYFKQLKTSRIFIKDELNKQWYIAHTAIKKDAMEKKMTWEMVINSLKRQKALILKTRAM